MKLLSVTFAPEAELFLYGLLAERTPEQSISHRDMPTLEEHARFVHSEPYEAWYIIAVGGLYVGSIYLTKAREVGLFILEDSQGKGYGHEALELLKRLHPGPLLANISVENLPSAEFFTHEGFKPLQTTMVLSNE